MKKKSVCILLMCHQIVLAESMPPHEEYCTYANSKEPDPYKSWLDKTHAQMSFQLCKQVNRIDSFFGNVNPTETAKGFLRIRSSIQWQQTDENSTEFKPSIKARVRLPNINRKLHLLISDDETEDNTIPSTKSSATRHQQQNGSSTLGELLGIPQAEPTDYDFDIGSKSDGGLRIFTRARATYQFWLKENSSLRLSQSLFWLDGLGFGEESSIEYNQAINDTTLFRWNTNAEFSEETQGLNISQKITFFQKIDDKRGLSYSIRVNGNTRPTLKVDEYGFDILFRRNIFKPWFFYEIEPSIYWPIEYNRDRSLRVILRLEVQLGDTI